MPSPMKFRAITANCGNDVIGEKASTRITTQLKEEQLDFVVINCQEVNFEKAKIQLEKTLGLNSDYTVTLLGKMSTHTKPLEQLHCNTGLASFVIHKKDLSIKVTDRVKARRDVSRFSGSGFNKGGLVIDFTVTDLDKHITRLQTVSGHLDSKNTSKRTRDWANIHSAVGKKVVTDWNELVQAMPNIRIAGYDANTRNQYVDEHSAPVKIWESKIVPQELKAFQQAPLGGLHYSVESTYKTDVENIITDQDPKRPGFVRGGMLDFVDIAADVENSSSSAIITARVEAICSDMDDTKRDHDVIISPLQTYDQNKFSEFDRVKNQMIMQLHTSAPDMVKAIAKYTAKDEKKLFGIYNNYLSKDGLINKQIELQADLLGNINKIKKINGGIGDKIATLLLIDTAWFSSSAKDVKTKQEFQEVVSDALSSCRTELDLDFVDNALHDPAKNTVLLRKAFQDIIIKSNASILPEVQDRCMQRAEDLIRKINTSYDPRHPEKKAGIIIQAALEFTGDLYKELRLLQKSNSAGKEGARSVLLGMIKLVKVVVINLIDLFVKESSPEEKHAQSKKIDGIVRHINLNLPSWLDRLRLNLKSRMVSKDFSKMKTKAGTQKSNALQEGESLNEKSSSLTRRR